MTERLKRIAFGTIGAIALSCAAGVTACDKVPLLAPTGSTINLSASSRTLPINGSTGLTAFVTESSGTPVQNGTTVRFTTTLGTVDPVETQTTNGLAVANFLAGTLSGLAEIHAISGGAGGATGTGTSTGSTAANVITITIGAAAVNSLTLRATPSSVGPSGGDIQITATVVDTNGGALAGIPVNFSSDQGFLNPGTATTDSSGQAITTLTTSQATVVTGVAGTKTATVTVAARLGPGITITCTPAGGTGTNCAAVAQSDSSNTATVVFTVSKAASTSNLRDATIDFGDGSSQSLGNLAGGAATVSHTYNGPASYTATARAVDVNGETTSASTPVNVTPRGAFTVATFTATPGTGANSRTVTFAVTVTGGTPQSYAWNFGDSGSDSNTVTTNSATTSHVYSSTGNKTATVTVTATDGRTASGHVEFVVQ